MKNFKLSGKFSFIWLLALAVLLITGIRLVRETANDRENAVEAFAQNGAYPKLNNTFMVMMR